MRWEYSMKGIKFKLIAVILIGVALLNGCVAEKAPHLQVKIQVDANQVVGVLDSTLWANIGYEGLYGDTTDERLQPFWELVQQTCAIRYIRCHNLFTDGVCHLGGSFLSGQKDVQRLLEEDNPSTELAGTGLISSYYYGCRIYSEDDDGKPKLDFWHLDHVFDILLSAGVKPIVECDYMPDALAEGQPVRNYAGGLINTPKDYTKWWELIYQTVKHCVDRYGVEEVRSWYWEIWNEPDLYNYFVDGVSAEVTPTAKEVERFLRMYDCFADGAKAAEPGVRVGGPAIAGHAEYLTIFLEHCVNGTNYVTGNKGAPLDFISWHAYGSTDELAAKNINRLDIIEAYPQLKDLELLQDEWGQGFWPNPPTTLTHYEAAFLCKFLDTILIEPSRKPGLFLRWGKIAHPDFTTGWRPLYVWMSDCLIPLPIMNAYIMLAKMGNERLELTGGSDANGVHGFASRTDNGIQILLYRFIEQDTLDTSPPVEIELTVKDVPSSISVLKHYRIDSNRSNAMKVWEDMGRPATPNERQLRELESTSQLQLLAPPSRVKTKNGQTTIRLSLPANAVSLVVLGEELSLPFIPGVHITEVLKHEAMYKNAQRKLAVSDTQGAKVALEALIEDCVPDESSTLGPNPHCFWGQKALFALAKLEEEAGNNAAADLIWQHLLKTTLNDTDRFVLLKARLKYLESSGNTLELNSLHKELQIVRSRLEVFAWWTVWADTPTK